MRIAAAPNLQSRKSRLSTDGYFNSYLWRTKMPSQLIGLIKKLDWSEFRRQVPANTSFAAQIHSTFTVSAPTFQRSGGSFQLTDMVTVRIVFDPSRSWRIPSMNQWPTQLQQELLEHEQGHYDITAAMARDCFIAIM
jgi:hypothetical protein